MVPLHRRALRRVIKFNITSVLEDIDNDVGSLLNKNPKILT